MGPSEKESMRSLHLKEVSEKTDIFASGAFQAA